MTTEDHSAKAMADMIVSCTSVGLQGAAGSLTRNEICENARKRSMSSSSCYSGAMYLSDHDIGEEDGSDDYPHFGEKKRRLTFEQVKALEKSFELRNKLDPERKMQLTKALGLHPRQISIWFQNRRARWKAKQLEKDFDALKHEYETLKRNYDALLQKNRQFKAEAQRLSRELENSDRSSKVGVSEIEPYQKPANSVPTKTTFPMELSVKSEISITCTEQPQHNYPTSKDQEGGCYSYMTEVASSAFNIESPRTIESPQSPGVPQMAAASANRFSPAQVMEGSLEGELAAANDLKPPPPGLHEWHCLPKVEVDQSAEESWCNLLYSLEEQGSLMLSEYCRVPGE